MEHTEHLRKAIGLSFRNLSVYGRRPESNFQRFMAGITRTTRTTPAPEILHQCNGLVKSGEMLLVLGRPGSGCTTLLKTLAGETHGLLLGDLAVLNYQGIPPHEMHSQFRGESLYTSELDVHFAELSTCQTLQLATTARITSGRLNAQSISSQRDLVIDQLGLSNVTGTVVGNEMIRGLSGGERRRTTIAEALVAKAPFQCWDNATRGLDSATALQFIQVLRRHADDHGATIVVTLYQISDAIFKLFDKVTLLYEGRQVYFGETAKAQQYFESLGFSKPSRATLADFLTSLTYPLEAKHFSLPIQKQGDSSPPILPPVTAHDFELLWRHADEKNVLESTIEAFDVSFPTGKPDHSNVLCQIRNHEKSGNLRKSSAYTRSYSQQIGLCLRRGQQRIRNNLSIPISTVVGNVAMAVIVGSVFFNLDESSSSLSSRSILIFFASVLNSFMSAFEVLTIWDQRPICEKHQRYAFYHPSTEAISAMVCDVPSKLITSVSFNAALYYMANLRSGSRSFLIFFLISFVSLITMSSFFRMIGSISRTMAQTMVPVAILNLNFIIYTGFIIPVQDMRPWLKWVGYINPIAYSYEGLIINEFQNREFPCTTFQPSGPGYTGIEPRQRACSVSGIPQGSHIVHGNEYIEANFGYHQSHLWRNVGILLAMWLVFTFVHLMASEYVLAEKPKGEVLQFRRSPASKVEALVSQADEENGTVQRLDPMSDWNVFELQPIRQGLYKHPIMDRVVCHWESVGYSIPIKGGSKTILHGIDGWVKPGSLTALMGVTGAGKTTLLDVLASRVSIGSVSGDIYINGNARSCGFQRQTGYVIQQDLHLSTATVREALQFSALLRHPGTTKREKLHYVEQVITVLEMQSYANAIIGEPGQGLNVEQRRRLSIGVELVAKPHLLLFLDEPTSGLDSQTAWAICSLLKKLAHHGQAILCTIHQPSSILFQQFDRLLLLSKGESIYFGDISNQGEALIRYLETQGARACEPHENPAEWMLEVTSDASVDWGEKWRQSPANQNNKQQLTEWSMRTDMTESLATETQEYSSTFINQLYLTTFREFQHQWRSPHYVFSKVLLALGSAFFLGISFWRVESSLRGLQGLLFSIFLLFSLFSTIIQLLMPEFISRRSLYEARERASKMYSWIIFLTAFIVVETFWQTILSVLVFVAWYYPMGLHLNIGNSAPERGILMFLLIWNFFLFSTTFAIVVIITIRHAEVGVNIAQFFFYMALIFCGVLVDINHLPRFWVFMYRISPLSYLLKGIAAVGIAHKPIHCTLIEYRTFSPPASQTCGQYMSPYLLTSGGTLADAASTGICQYCPLSDTDQYLALVGVAYRDKWWAYGLTWGYIIFNVIVVFILYWLTRVRHRS